MPESFIPGPGCGFDDGLCGAAEEEIDLLAVPGPELPARGDHDAVGAVADEDGSLRGADEDPAALAVVDRRRVDVVEQVDAAVLAVTDNHLLACKLH